MRAVEVATVGTKERLRQLMQETGLTNQSELARRLHPPEKPTWINNRLSGYAEIKADEIPRIARALGVPCWRFFEDSDCPDARRRGEASEGDLIDAYMDSWIQDAPPEEREFVLKLRDLRELYRAK